ncbi:MAG: hypothetical protein GF329_06450 [Candidatus Lokiarchaeota archaeon]|nr:hypothetical protein [Candidatus Lokiarchaeota archaeon]
MKKNVYYILAIVILGICVLNINTTNAMVRQTNEPEIKHIPVKTAKLGYDLLISCDVEWSGNFIVQLNIRKPGVWQFNLTNMTRAFGKTYYAVVPSANITEIGIEYYLRVYVDENTSSTYPIADASDDPITVSTVSYQMDLNPTLIYAGIVFVSIFAALYAVDIIEIKNPWGGKKDE